MKVSKEQYKEMIEDDIKALRAIPESARSLELDHVISILRGSVNYYYPEVLPAEESDGELNRIKSFITGEVTYDKDGQYFWVKDQKDGLQMLAELRGWGRIQNMFKDQKEAAKFQDELGHWIASAINKSLSRPDQEMIEVEKNRFEWSLKTFPEATALSSLQKLKDEADEVEKELIHGHSGEELQEEYADCLMCLFDSAGRAGITPEQLLRAFALKHEKNKSRKWIKNENNSYSHVKQ